MKTVRPLANILFWLTRFAAIIYIVTAFYALAAIILSAAGVEWAPLKVEDNASFVIFYPFTSSPFLLGDYNAQYLTMMIFIISFYALFLWLLSGVFNAFRQQKLFTPKSVLRLSRFYITNLSIPILSVIAAFLFYQEGASDIMMIAFLHLVIGVFAFFMAAIFRQGLVLQEEQDLTL